MQQTPAVSRSIPHVLDSNAFLGWLLHAHLPQNQTELPPPPAPQLCGLYGLILACACRKALLEKGGLEIWAKVLKGALRSSAFLGMYCTLCWRGACVGFQTTKSCSPPVIAASCWTGEHVHVPCCAGHD